MAGHRYLFLLFCLVGFSHLSGQMVVGADTLIGNEWITYGQKYFKFTIDADGIYRIPYSTLTSAGVSSSATGSKIRIYTMGQQVPLFVSTSGVLGSNDFIEFYGFKNKSELDWYLFRHPDTDLLHPEHSMYTDQRVYYLTTEGDEQPLRVNTLVNDISNPPAAEPYDIHRQILDWSDTSNDPYLPISGGGAISYSSYLHGEGFGKAAESNSTTQIVTTSRATGPDATLRIRLTSTNHGNHNFVVSWNGMLLDTIFAKGIQIKDTTFSIPFNLVQDNNQVNINNTNSLSRHSLVTMELAYPRLLDASGALETLIYPTIKSGAQYFVIDGFMHNGNQPLLYSSDGQSRMVADINGNSQVHFVWPEVSQEMSLRLTNPLTSIHTISTLTEKVFTDYAGDNTEYVIITHPDLMQIGTESEYVQYRASAAGGAYRAKAYSILELYDEFGYGIVKHPQAIRNFVEFMHRKWPAAKMIFIVGRGVEYNRSRYTNGSWESYFFVPTCGRPGSDNLLAATLWDLVPRYPIARLAVIEPTAIQIYLDKVKEHDLANQASQTLEEKAWIKNVIHIAGGKNTDEQSGFRETLNSLGTDITNSDFGANVYYFQKESTDVIGESTSKQIERLLKEGSSIINYLGHSSTSTFEFTINEPVEWNNKGRYPVFSAMGCSAGQIHGTIFGLSDRYVQIQDEGAIAFISGSGSQFPNALVAWARPWYNHFGNLAYGSTLGESILFGLKALRNFINFESTGSNSYRYLLEQQTFQGDPALKINPLPGPDYLLDPNSVTVSPEILNTDLDSFDLSFSITNIGRNLREPVSYTIRLRSPEGEELELWSDTARCEAFSTPIIVRLPLKDFNQPGTYRILLEVDPGNQIHELPAPQAESNNNLMDNLGIQGIQVVLLNNLISAVYPPDYSIISSAPEFVAASSNAFRPSQDFIIELDTTPFFNSPLLVREIFPSHPATLKWVPPFNYTDDQEYYWRVSLDSISPEQGYLWSKRTFLYKTGSAPGWNQSHFYQETENRLENLLTDSLSQTFDFESAVTNFRILNRFQKPSTGGLPFGYIDNVFYTEFFTKFSNNDVHVFVVAINPVTGAIMRNPNPGLYGSFNNLSYTIRCFPYRTDLAESRQALINFIQHIIPPEYYVILYTYQRDAHPDYFPEQWASDEENFEHSIFSMVESEYPESAIRALANTGSKPYIVMFQKGHGGLEEVIAADTADAITLSYDIKGSLGQGTMVSSLIGPASKWYSIHWDLSHAEQDTTGKDNIAAWALSADLSDTLLISSSLLHQDTTIEDINAVEYPYIQLAFYSQDTIDFKPSELSYWRVLFEGLPELVILNDFGFEFLSDTLNQGEIMSLSAYVENVSSYDVDSVPVTLQIISQNNTAEELSTTLKDIKGRSGAFVEFEKNTGNLQGDYQVLMEVNPDRIVREFNYSNNIGILPMHVRSDKANPILDVTFDGYHIEDGDIVSAHPLIMIRLEDENQNLRLDDTSAFVIYLEFPADNSAKRIYFASPWVRFIPSPAEGPNICIVELTPELIEDGIYTLSVQAKDASGNDAGANDYLVSFEVVQAKSISYLYNFPNPFSTSTRFIYTLTGPGSPPSYSIEIISSTGIKVREITQSEIGPLPPGNHMTSYAWDGTDQNGARLSAGVYFFRMVVKDENGNDYPRYQPYGSGSTTNQEWGKLVIVR